MKAFLVICTGVAAISLSLFAHAADSAASGSAMKGDSYSTKAKTMGEQKADAKAQENMRLDACKPMTGAEKKACLADAKKTAATQMNKSNSSDAAMSTSTAPKK